MALVIETNISLDENNNFIDHQSRVVEVDSWDDLVQEVINKKPVIRKAYLGIMYGVIIPRNCTIENLVYNDYHLSCDITTYNGFKSKKLLYLVKY
jgi:hypothetical protein